MNTLARLLTLALAMLGCAAVAQEAWDSSGRVARLSYVQGEVSLMSEGDTDWVTADLNRPLTSGDELWVESGSRAELQAGFASLHLDERTSLSFVDVEDSELRISLTEGTVNVQVENLEREEIFAVQTPNATVSLVRAGEYRISVEDDGNTTVVGVRSGESEIAQNRQIFNLEGGQEGRFSGVDYLNADVGSIRPRDDFEAWADDRNRRDERSVSSRYVSREVVGYEDLDEHGSWYSEPEYGHVWYPHRVSAGWAPYRFGHWVWVRPWGWTWIDRAPWGFAPFHYGRWAYVRSRWCWVPEPRHIRPRYAPALVGWVGNSPREGWVPLGPREKYVPHHHRRGHVQYKNRHALTVGSQEAFKPPRFGTVTTRPPTRVVERDVKLQRERTVRRQAPLENRVENRAPAVRRTLQERPQQESRRVVRTERPRQVVERVERRALPRNVENRKVVVREKSEPPRSERPQSQPAPRDRQWKRAERTNR